MLVGPAGGDSTALPHTCSSPGATRRTTRSSSRSWRRRRTGRGWAGWRRGSAASSAFHDAGVRVLPVYKKCLQPRVRSRRLESGKISKMDSDSVRGGKGGNTSFVHPHPLYFVYPRNNPGIYVFEPAQKKWKTPPNAPLAPPSPQCVAKVCFRCTCAPDRACPSAPCSSRTW